MWIVCILFSTTTFAIVNPFQQSKEKKHTDMRGNYEVIQIIRFIKRTNWRLHKSEAKKIAMALVKYGHEADVDPRLAAALIARESSFNRMAVSSTGAKGLGQIKEFNFKSLNISDPYNIDQNVRGTVYYLKEMLNGWESHDDQKALALGSYFRGINHIRRQNGQLDPHAQRYVDKILYQYRYRI